MEVLLRGCDRPKRAMVDPPLNICEKNKQAGINAKEQSLEYLNQHAESIALIEIVIEIKGEENFTDEIFAL